MGKIVVGGAVLVILIVILFILLLAAKILYDHAFPTQPTAVAVAATVPAATVTLAPTATKSAPATAISVTTVPAATAAPVSTATALMAQVMSTPTPTPIVPSNTPVPQQMSQPTSTEVIAPMGSVRAVQPGTTVPAGTIVVLRQTDYAKKTVDVRAVMLMTDLAASHSDKGEVALWTGYGSLAIARVNACNEAAGDRTNPNFPGYTVTFEGATVPTSCS